MTDLINHEESTDDVDGVRHVANFKAVVMGSKTDAMGNLQITITISRETKWQAAVITDEGPMMLDFVVTAPFEAPTGVDEEGRRHMLERIRQGLDAGGAHGRLGDGSGGVDNTYEYGKKESDRIDTGLVTQTSVRATRNSGS